MHQVAHQLIDSVQVGDDAPYFLFCQNDGDVDALLRSERLDVLVFQRYAQHLRVEEQNGIECFTPGRLSLE